MPDRPRRLFVPELPDHDCELELPHESAHHVRVLRLSAGTRVQLFDGRSGEASASVHELSRERVVCRVQARVQIAAPAHALHFVLGLPKGQKLEDVTRMLTELGVSSLHLALCERSVPRPHDARTRMARLERIALEACAQSGQARIPTLHPPRPLLEIAAELAGCAHKLVFFERAEQSFSDSWPAPPPPREVCAFVGPEGGFSREEVSALHNLGVRAVGLGPALLRVETAAPVVAGLLLERIGAFIVPPATPD